MVLGAKMLGACVFFSREGVLSPECPLRGGTLYMLYHCRSLKFKQVAVTLLVEHLLGCVLGIACFTRL